MSFIIKLIYADLKRKLYSKHYRHYSFVKILECNLIYIEYMR